MKYINDKKENIYNILRVLIILHFCVVNNGQGCQGSAKVVASCPKSVYLWTMHAKIECTVSNNYHCLITENHRDDKPSIIECCMKPQNITRGHMPRYNLNKNELQEIECQEDYYMPTQFSSNRYRDHDVQHCKYMKSNCNMEGMKICNHGSTTTDRSCYCDYKELYVPELPLDRGEHCFSLKDNLCRLRNDCDRTYQELNMMYQCVNICKTGYFRPENEIICRLLPEGTTVAGKVTGEVSVPDIIKPTLKTSTPTTSTKDNMVKPEIENQGPKDNHIVAIGVGLVCIATTIGGFVIVIYLLQRYRKGKFKVQDEESGLLPEIEVQKEKYREVYGSEVVLKVKIPHDVRSICWFFYGSYKDHDDNPQLITSNDSRYSEFNVSHPSLKINNLCKQSAGSYICKVTMKDEEETPIESRKIQVEVIEPVFNLKKTLIDVEYGREVTLECEILDRPKHYDFYWEKEVDENVKELKISDETKEKYSGCTKSYPNLTIKDADHGDNALYCFCIKYQSSTDECEIFRSSKIKVHVVNEPSVEMIKNTKDVFIGENISFGCIINHRPKTFEVIWEKIAADNEENSEVVIFDEETKDKYESYNTSNKPHLTIKDAEESDDALYRCFIRYLSSVGEQIAISDKVRLHVKEKEPLIAGDTHNIGTYIEDIHQMNTGLKSVDIQRFTRRASDSSSSSDFNDSKAEKYPKVDDQAENTASRNGASTSNGSGSENQHAEHITSDIDILSQGNRQKLRNLNPEGTLHQQPSKNESSV